jgi:hypothetical protein
VTPPSPGCISDSDCDDALFCNGAEFCDANGECQSGENPCHDESCNEDSGECDEVESELKIEGFKVTKRISLERVKGIVIKLDIKNDGKVDSAEEAAQVTGTQNGVEVYNERILVSDPIGHGNTRYVFPSYTPTAAGDIRWTATIIDDDPDSDEKKAKTKVVGDTEEGHKAGGLDLDIKGFRVTKRISLKKVKGVVIKLEIKNDGEVDSVERTARVTGVQNSVEVYNKTMLISDPVGHGHTSWIFPSYTPTAAGDIKWTAAITDDDPDIDEAMAKTKVFE